MNTTNPSILPRSTDQPQGTHNPPDPDIGRRHDVRSPLTDERGADGGADQETSSRLCNAVIAGDVRPIDTDTDTNTNELSRPSAGDSRAHTHDRSLKTTVSIGSPVLDGSNYKQAGEEVVRLLEDYVPQVNQREWKRVRKFVIDAAYLTARNQSSYDSTRLMSVAGPFVIWCTSAQGLPMEAAALFIPKVIDSYCTEVDLSNATRATYRSALLAISKTLLPDAHTPAMTPLHKRTIKAPYSTAEIKKFRAWAKGQHTLVLREKAMMLLALAAGAGLAPGEIGQVVREDVVIDSDGVVIHVRGTKARVVPVLRYWEPWMVTVAESRNTGDPIWGLPRSHTSENALSNFTRASMGEAPVTTRLRATWITEHLAKGTPLKELFRAGGISQLDNLDQYLHFVHAADQFEYRRFLRGDSK
jgi:integrase